MDNNNILSALKFIDHRRHGTQRGRLPLLDLG